LRGDSAKALPGQDIHATKGHGENTHAAGRFIAIAGLVTACLLWGLSFPVSKALTTIHLADLPGESSWLAIGLQGSLRFWIATFTMVLLFCRQFATITRLELSQGVGIGFFGGAGFVFQMDGLAHTSASTSAFLTQAYCALIPTYFALRCRRWPSLRTTGACVLVVIGVAVLSGFDPKTFSIGRGELETLIGACFFAGQILWLEQRRFVRNRTGVVVTIMLTIIAGIMTIVAGIAARRPEQLWQTAFSPESLMLITLLVVFCTLGASYLMIHFQPVVTSIEAGLIYCTEPLFGSLFALFLPGLISTLTGIAYANETVTQGLVVGGSLILFANLLMQLPGWRKR
jgi:drug/metabolite transporter (DMT)-like permease